MNSALHPALRNLAAAAVGIALACLSIGLAAAPALGAFPGRDGAIAFERAASGLRSGSGDIWVQSRSGKERRLTRSPGVEETTPTFSPDGRMIAYVRRQRGDADVWLMRSDGSDKRPLVDGEQDELQPAFFPSGRSLAFTVFDGSRDWDIHSVRIDGTHRRWLVQRATFPAISPNGRWLAFSKDGEGGGVRLQNLRSGKVRRLTTGSAQELDFSPDGRRIVFTGQRRCRPGKGDLRFAVLTVGVGGGHSRFLRRSCRREFISPAWSPNGSRIVFTRKTLEGRRLHFQLAMMTASGAPVGGAPAHHRGSEEIFPAWQALR